MDHSTNQNAGKKYLSSFFPFSFLLPFQLLLCFLRSRTDNRTGLYYADYLKIDKLLSCVEPESEKLGQPAHDEHLFIVIHQGTVFSLGSSWLFFFPFLFPF